MHVQAENPDTVSQPSPREGRGPAVGRASMVDFERVSLRYGQGVNVLSDVSFSLMRGSFHFLTGSSGAGKSSLLRLIYLAVRPTQGRMGLFGYDSAAFRREHVATLRRRMGVVFQDFRLLNHLSVLDNVALPLRVAGARESHIQRQVPELLEWVGLADHMHATPPTLSGGQAQRVAIARAVITQPDLLLADEPTGNVDDDLAMRLLYLFEEMNKLGTTVLIATHSDYLVSRFQHPRLHLNQGFLTEVR